MDIPSLRSIALKKVFDLITIYGINKIIDRTIPNELLLDILGLSLRESERQSRVVSSYIYTMSSACDVFANGLATAENIANVVKQLKETYKNDVNDLLISIKNKNERIMELSEIKTNCNHCRNIPCNHY